MDKKRSCTKTVEARNVKAGDVVAIQSAMTGIRFYEVAEDAWTSHSDRVGISFVGDQGWVRFGRSDGIEVVM
jgi:hypothetical protein